MIASPPWVQKARDATVLLQPPDAQFDCPHRRPPVPVAICVRLSPSRGILKAEGYAIRGSAAKPSIPCRLSASGPRRGMDAPASRPVRAGSASPWPSGGCPVRVGGSNPLTRRQNATHSCQGFPLRSLGRAPLLANHRALHLVKRRNRVFLSFPMGCGPHNDLPECLPPLRGHRRYRGTAAQDLPRHPKDVSPKTKGAGWS